MERTDYESVDLSALRDCLGGVGAKVQLQTSDGVEQYQCAAVVSIRHAHDYLYVRGKGKNDSADTVSDT
jgi:hypothetical protein